MAHFAKIVDSVVEQVIVIGNLDAPDPAPNNSEPLGQEFIRDVLKLEGEWIQTSRNNNFRAHFAGPGMVWDSENDVFYRPQPYESWSLDTTTWLWNPPIPRPDDVEYTVWDEWSGNWVVQAMPIEVWNRIGEIQFSSIIEVGCLLGSVTNKLAETYPTATVKGIDIDTRGIELAKEYYDDNLFEVKNVFEEDLNQFDVVIFDSPLPTDENPTPAEDVLNYVTSIGFSGKLLLGVYQSETFIQDMTNVSHIVDRWYEFDF